MWKMLGWMGLALVALAVHELRPYRVGWPTRRGCECGEAKPSEMCHWLVGMLPASGARRCTDRRSRHDAEYSWREATVAVASPTHPLPAGRLNALATPPPAVEDELRRHGPGAGDRLGPHAGLLSCAPAVEPHIKCSG